MFGSDNLVFVPEGGQLVLDDVYHWRRFRLDVRRLEVRLRTAAFDEVVGNVRSALRVVESNPKNAKRFDALSGEVDSLLKDLALIAGPTQTPLIGQLGDVMRNDAARWWIRLGDRAAESFDREDYEPHRAHGGDVLPYLTYGMVALEKLDDLEIPLAGEEGEDGLDLPFSLELAPDALSRWTMPLDQPLALVREFCGARGVSCRGHSVNLNAQAEIEPLHELCTPLSIIGTGLFATLYLHYPVQATAPVIGRLRPGKLHDSMTVLERSGFVVIGEGSCHRIYQRDGDVIHLYDGLEGKESEGMETMPPFLVVAAAEGSTDPESRADLFEAIRSALGMAR